MKILKTKKEQHENQKTRKSEGNTPIQKLLLDKNKDAYTEEGAKALDAIGVKVLYMWKHGNTRKEGQTKPQLLTAWNAAKNNPIEDNNPWKTEDQSELEILDSKIIRICNTEIGRQTKKVVDHTLAVLPKNVKISAKSSEKRDSFQSVYRFSSQRSLYII